MSNNTVGELETDPSIPSEEADSARLHTLEFQRALLSEFRELKELLTDSGPSFVRLMGDDNQLAAFNRAGQLLTAPGPFDNVVFNELATINTAYNFFQPDGKRYFLLTGFLVYGDKQVNASTNATVIIYEASQPDSVTVDKVLFQFEVGQNQSIPFPNIRVLVNKGVYVNAKTDDDDIHMTIVGHYIDFNGE